MSKIIVKDKPPTLEQGLKLLKAVVAREPTPRPKQPERIYRLKDLTEITGLKKSAIYEAIQNGEFPAPVKLTSRASGWPASDIIDWLESRKRR